MSHEPFDTLAAAWALGALDGEDRAAFERHLAEGCDVCAAELRSSAEALAAVARSVPPMIPPPEVKAALLGRINATAPTRRDAARPRRLVWAVASLVAVLAVAGFTATLVATRYEARLGQMVLLRADVTANTADDKALLKRFRLFGPPGIIFFDARGREIEGLRVIGYQSPEKFIKSLDLALR